MIFRVPFCGLDYQASKPVVFFEPNVTRMGTDSANTVFRISHSLGYAKSVSVELDKVYSTGPELIKIPEGDGDYRFTVSNQLVSQYQNLVIRIEGAEPYVVPLPAQEKPKPKPTLDLNAKPPQIVKGSVGPAEWSGANLIGSNVADTLRAPLFIAPTAALP